MCDANTKTADTTPAVWPEKRGNSGQTMSQNIAKKLQLREIRGCLQPHPYGPCFDLLPKVPPRLKYRLCDLIRESIQRFGHIFLGFTKDGHHVLSYSMQMDLYLPPTFNYRLYWWRFRPHQPLRKVAEVKIFGEEDISSDLLINVCQWPSDDSKLVIYGVNQESRGHQGPCYLTIAANPPLDSCDDCKESSRRLHGGLDGSLNDVNEHHEAAWEMSGGESPLCLRHSFVLHLQFNLVPPFPEFNPFVSLQRDGQVVINTGDSIVALSVSTEVKIQRSRSAHSSPIAMEDDDDVNDQLSSSPSSSTTAAAVAAGVDRHSEDDHRSFEWLEVGKVMTLGKLKAPTTAAAPTAGESDLSTSFSSSSSSSVDTSPFGQLQRHNVCSKDIEDSNGDCDLRTLTDARIARRPQEGTTPSSSSSTSSSSSSSSAVTSGIATNFEVLMYSLKQTETGGGGSAGGGTGSAGGGAAGGLGGTFESVESVKENVAPDTELSYKIQRGCSRFGVQADGSGLGLLSSPLQSSPPPPPSPEAFSRLQQPSCVMRVKRVFVPQRDVGADDVEEDDDVGNWVYHGSLPLEVHWPSGTPLVPCPRSLLNEVTGPTLVARQAIFDVEQYLHEMAEQLCTEAGKKFQVFDDYDIEIVDVLSETSDVIVLATMIVQATPKSGLTKSQRNISISLRQQYETGFTFVWSVETGKYEVVDTETFKEVDVSKVKRGVQRGWNPGKKQCADFQTKWRIPRCRFNEVAVLTNETIFTGVSLKEILSPSGDVAIVL